MDIYKSRNAFLFIFKREFSSNIRWITSAVCAALLIYCCLSADKTFANNRRIDDSEKLIRAALAAMGGEERIRNVKAVKLEAVGHWNLLEQSERPEGPWIVNYDQVTELRDFAGWQIRQSSEGRSLQLEKWMGATRIVSNGVAAVQFGGQPLRPARKAQVQDSEEWLALGPERILLTALEAKDLRKAPDTVVQGVPHRVALFTWKDAECRLLINANTNLPTAVEYVRAHPFDAFWSVWGDVTTRTYFSAWSLEPGGIHYPRQWNTERNGTPYRTLTVTNLELNPTLAPDAFVIPDNIRAAFTARAGATMNDIPLGRPDKPAQEIGEGVVFIPGAWNVMIVRQTDGIVIVEAPISSGYSEKVISEAQKRFPGLPVKAVISTSDSFPHIGGLREYAARRIPIFALDLNKPILERLFQAPHRLSPDALSRSGRQAKFTVVSGKTVLGEGKNRLEIYPVRGETGERMLMVYMPEKKFLYASDLVIKQPDGTFFMPQYLTEVIDAARRENLSVDSVFAMHSENIKWNEVTAAVNQIVSAR